MYLFSLKFSWVSNLPVFEEGAPAMRSCLFESERCFIVQAWTLGFKIRMIYKSMDLKATAFIGRLTEFWRRRLLQAEISEPVTKPIALITGGSGGIGAAFAQELAEAGHNILLIGQNEEKLHAVATRLQGLGSGTILSLALDVSQLNLHQMIEDLLEDQGFHVDILVNNAGLGERDSFLKIEWDEIQHVLNVNIVALTALTHRFLPGMTARGKGALLNVASIGGLAPGPYNSIYFSSKSFVINFTESLANEVRGRGVYIGAVLPGPTKTAFHHKVKGQNTIYNYLLWKMKARAVARSMHRALLMRTWAVITPSLFYSLIALCLRVIPGSLSAPLMGFLFKKRSF